MATITANGNCADGNAIQNNINDTLSITINNYESNPSEALIDSTLASFNKRKAESPDVMQHFGRKFYRAELESIPTSRSTSESTHRSIKKYCFLKDISFTTCCFYQNHKILLKQWPSPTDTKRIMEILNDEDIGKIRRWIEVPSSNVLFFNLSGDTRERLRWTTDFALELMGRVGRPSQKYDSTETTHPILAHFCGERTSLEHWERDAIHDLLVQLRSARKDHYNGYHICKTYSHCQNGFHSQPVNSRDYWLLLNHCVEYAGIKSLYIILDNIDSIYNRIRDQKDRTIFETFLENLQSFLSNSHDGGVPVKLLITSRSQKAAQDLRKLNDSHLTLDQVSDRPGYFKDAAEINLSQPPAFRHRR